MAWYDITNTAELGKRAIYEPTTQTADDANQPVATFIVTPATDITVELRIISVTALTALANEYCIATIFGVGGGSGGGSGSVSFPITPTINDHGNVGTTTEDIDLSLSTGHVHKITLTGNPTLTFSNPPASGTQIEFEIEFIQDGTGNRTVTYPATVVETVSISQTADSTTIVTFRTNDGGTNYHAVPALRGSISLSGSTVFASRQLDNLDTPLLNVGIDCNSKTFSNWVGWTAGVGQTFDVGGTGGTWNLPSGDTHTFRVNGADQIIIQENAINVNSHSLTNYIGYTAGVGQTVVLDGTGEVHTLPTGDTYDYKINGTSEFTISSLGVGVAESLQFQDSATTPTTNGEMQRNGTDVIVYTGGSAVNLSNIAILPFDDNQVIIQDEADNTKTLTFNLSLQDASAANLLSWASGGSRTHTFSSTSGTLAQLNLAQTFTTTQTFSATVGIDMQNKKIDLDGDSDTSISSPSDDAMTFEVGGDTRFLLTASSADFVVPLEISSNALTGVSTLSMDGAGIIKSASASEIAFQVTNDSISIGIEGTVQIPQKTGSSSTAAQADTDFGDATGCMGIYMNDTSKVHLLVVKQPDGAWAAVVLTDNVLV